MKNLPPALLALTVSAFALHSAGAALIMSDNQTAWESGTASTLVSDFEGIAPNDQPPGGNFVSSSSIAGNGATIDTLNANGFVFSVVDRDYMGSDFYEPEATAPDNTGFTINFDSAVEGFAFDFANFGRSVMTVTITVGAESVSMSNLDGTIGFMGIRSDTPFLSATVTATELDIDSNPVAAGYPSYDNVRSISTVPEPSDLWMAASALGGLLLIMRRR